MIIIKVLVQMPDGSFKKLPVATQDGLTAKIVKQPTKKEARDWAEVILPERIYLEEE